VRQPGKVLLDDFFVTKSRVVGSNCNLHRLNGVGFGDKNLSIVSPGELSAWN
jgi:hypothetical protein